MFEMPSNWLDPLQNLTIHNFDCFMQTALEIPGAWLGQGELQVAPCPLRLAHSPAKMTTMSTTFNTIFLPQSSPAK